ncbi:glycosyltransferase family 4 protein [Brumimicrobium aurantiacum]|uniref:Glycosyltransferase family 1 protein n=1 Tax=Brumimicrobium aurantiacum TaxID=1737063 RepID=A0A3E1EYZ5_9FLAO|nr:glycosyltransferase family 4 protein [Brumimicrobium aurantiacum]RFC54785.1 glycosyltransferase family 1 protein [Brumimicrobium aurantiacum]
MKIIFLESVHNFAGSSKSTLELAERLQNHGHDVLIVDFWGCSSDYIDACHNLDVPIKILDKREKPIILGKNPISIIKYFFKTIGYRKAFNNIIAEFKPNLVSVNTTKTLGVLRKSQNYKITYFARGWFLPNQIGFFDKYLIKTRADKILTVSHATSQMVQALGISKAENIFTIPNTVNVKNTNSSDDTNIWYKSTNREFVMMHCGSFIKTKGQHVTIEVLKELIERGLNVKLLLVGIVSNSSQSKRYFDQVKNIIEKHNLVGNIETIVNQSDVLHLYHKTDILIHPSYSEGLPRVVLEAMSLGKPVIGNAVGGMNDIISNNYNGFLTSFNSVSDYVMKIESLINGKEKYRFMSKNALNLMKSTYSEEEQVKAFEKVLTR